MGLEGYKAENLDLRVVCREFKILKKKKDKLLKASTLRMKRALRGR